MASKHSYPKEKIRVLLLEGIDPAAEEEFRQAGYQVEMKIGSLSESELIDIVGKVHVIGIRSKTQLSAKVLENAPRLLSIGCYCIGTDQVALQAAASQGVPVFNAPFSNTRSVAELAMAEIVMLSRKAAFRSQEMHKGEWRKSAKGCHEVRGHTVGIVGYGHIGPQLGMLAEAFGMKVLFFDIAKKLPLGNARAVDSLKSLLAESDFVTLHVPDTEQTRGMIGREELDTMKPGSFLLNLSRGKVVDIPELAERLRNGQLAGAALDVFPLEPAKREDQFENELCGLENVILTPHIGGSTEEAQVNIAKEVSQSLISFLDLGASAGSVNFPAIDLQPNEGCHRILNIHRNVPGVLRDVNEIVAATNANIEAQYLVTREDVGYLVMDVDRSLSAEVKSQLEQLDSNIRTRLLY